MRRSDSEILDYAQSAIESSYTPTGKPRQVTIM